MVSIAKQVVRTSLDLTDQDVLLVHAWSHTADLASEIAREAIRVGADTHVAYFDDRMWLATLVEMDEKYATRKPRLFAGIVETMTAEVELEGPQDPKVFDRTKPERMAAMETWWKEFHDRQRERKVRSTHVTLGHVTPQRARKYGVSYPKWKRAVTAALGYDLKKLSTSGRNVGKRLAGTREIRITGKGTDLTLGAQGREAFVDDGIIDASDILRGALHTSLPTGAVNLAPLETEADGTVTFATAPLWGKMIRNLRWKFEAGQLVDYDADKNVKAFADYYEASKGDKDRIGWISVGLNPRATYLGGFLDSIVSGAVSIGVGANDELGGTNKGLFGWGATLPHATLEADDMTIVTDGTLSA